jgi:hypothetical protein
MEYFKMSRLKLLGIIIFLLASLCKTNAQMYRRIDLFTGYTWQKAHTIDIGIGYAKRSDSWWSSHYNIYMGGELLLEKDTKAVTGFKAGINLSTMVMYSNFQATYYTNFDDAQFGFRPEFGIGYPGDWSISYGYNIFTKANVLNIGEHAFTVRYVFKLSDKVSPEFQ